MGAVQALWPSPLPPPHTEGEEHKMGLGEPQSERSIKPRDSDSGSSGRIRLSFAWFAGARSQILEKTPSEKGFYSALGAAVLALALAGGITWTLGISYVLQVPAANLWAVGLGWAIFMVIIERLLLMFPVTRERWVAVGIQLIPRLVVSCAIGVLIAEPLVIRLYEPEIDRQMQADVQQAIQRSVSGVAAFYAPKITSAEAKIARIQKAEDQLKEKIERFRFLSECEAGDIRCSTTRRVGCGPFCRYYAQLARTAEAKFKTLKPQNDSQVGALQDHVKRLRAKWSDEEATGRAAITSSRGLMAREIALKKLARANPSVEYHTWFLRIFFWILDLLPIVIKTIRGLSIRSPYETLATEESAREELGAHRMREWTRVLKQRITLEARAAEEVDRAKIDFERDHKIAEEESKWGTRGRYDAQAASPDPSKRQPVAAWSLSRYVESMQRSHEHLPVEVSSTLMRAGWIGVAILVALAAAGRVYSTLAHTPIAGEWIVLMALAVTASLAVYTKGFRRAPAWALRAIFGVLLMALALPVLIVGINVS